MQMKIERVSPGETPTLEAKSVVLLSYRRPIMTVLTPPQVVVIRSSPRTLHLGPQTELQQNARKSGESPPQSLQWPTWSRAGNDNQGQKNSPSPIVSTWTFYLLMHPPNTAIHFLVFLISCKAEKDVTRYNLYLRYQCRHQKGGLQHERARPI